MWRHLVHQSVVEGQYHCSFVEEGQQQTVEAIRCVVLQKPEPVAKVVFSSFQICLDGVISDENSEKTFACLCVVIDLNFPVKNIQ